MLRLNYSESSSLNIPLTTDDNDLSEIRCRRLSLFPWFVYTKDRPTKETVGEKLSWAAAEGFSADGCDGCAFNQTKCHGRFDSRTRHTMEAKIPNRKPFSTVENLGYDITTYILVSLVFSTIQPLAQSQKSSSIFHQKPQLYIGLNVGTPHTRLTIVVDTILVTVALEALVVIVASSAVQQRWS